MKYYLFAITYFFTISFPSFSQDQSESHFQEEVKMIEQLTIKALKLRSNITPNHQNEKLTKELNAIDSVHLKLVSQFLDKYGWRSKKEIGEIANMGLFLAIQHSSKEEMQNFKLIVEKAYEENTIAQSDYATFIDRLQVQNDLPQIYGTQYYYDEKSSALRFYEIKDIKNVNKRRKEVELPKIERFAKQNNIHFD